MENEMKPNGVPVGQCQPGKAPKQETDMRMPHERGGNLFRDNPTPKADPRSIVK